MAIYLDIFSEHPTITVFAQWDTYQVFKLFELAGEVETLESESCIVKELNMYLGSDGVAIVMRSGNLYMDYGYHESETPVKFTLPLDPKYICNKISGILAQRANYRLRRGECWDKTVENHTHILSDCKYVNCTIKGEIVATGAITFYNCKFDKAFVRADLIKISCSSYAGNNRKNCIIDNESFFDCIAICLSRVEVENTNAKIIYSCASQQLITGPDTICSAWERNLRGDINIIYHGVNYSADNSDLFPNEIEYVFIHREDQLEKLDPNHRRVILLPGILGTDILKQAVSHLQFTLQVIGDQLIVPVKFKKSAKSIEQ